MKNDIVYKNLLVSLVVCCSALLLISCSSEKRETFTSGSLTMISSEEIFPIIDIQVKDFQRVYEEATITHRSMSTREAIVQLMSDSVKLIVTSRPLNEEEIKAAVANEFDIDSVLIAYDGIAVVVNERNALQKLSIDQLKNILSGTTPRWSSFRESGLSSAIVLAMGDPNSGAHEFLKTNVLHGAQFSPSLYPAASTDEIFSVVKERPNAIGFVSTARIASMPEGVKTIDIGDPTMQRDTLSKTMEYFQPHQAYVYQKLYPLTRSLYIYSRGTGKGVGRGFTSFAAGPEGQKIIVSNGLVPATMPVRLVQLQSP